AGRPARLLFKMNTFQDHPFADLIYRAAASGVQVDLIVRGICIVRPHLPDVSGKIRVISIVGRFLEHSRAFYFLNGGDEELYLGSADLMPRNLDRRVEVLFPIQDLAMRDYLKDQILELYLKDNIKARELYQDGSYHRITPEKGEEHLSLQDALLERAHKATKQGVRFHALPRSGIPGEANAPNT
ncbi:MAG: hypothetical protein M1298_00025, partial [Chloroflexi bacterium]|nr:hypothetical protein [Chloroflexota bacterium]